MPAHSRPARIGCFGAVVIAFASILLAGLHWVIAAVGAIVAAFVTHWAINRIGRSLVRRPDVLAISELGDYPDAQIHFANRLEQVCKRVEWSYELAQEIEALKELRNYDDALECAAVDIAEVYAERLHGRPSKSTILNEAPAAEIRAELHAILRDLRIETGAYKDSPTKH